MPPTTAIVIGGGIVGSSAAYELARHGARTTLVDREDTGYATQAGAGIVSAVSARHRDADWDALMHPSVAHYPRLVEQLAEDGVEATGYEPTEGLVIASTEEEARALAALHADLQEQGAAGAARFGTVSLVSGADARRLFPALAQPVRALHMTRAARVDGRIVRAALRTGLERRGGAVVTGSARPVVESGRAVGVEVGGRRLAADVVLLCAGAWAPELDPGLPAIPVHPQRGQIAHLRMPGGRTGDRTGREIGQWPFVVGYHSHYLLPFDDRVVVGATREHGAGFDHRLTAGGVHEVLGEALRVAPGLAGATVGEIRIGFRPATPDGLPFLGRAGDVEGLYVATGHGASGLTAGPFSGAMVARLALGEEPPLDLRPYALARPMR